MLRGRRRRRAIAGSSVNVCDAEAEHSPFALPSDCVHDAVAGSGPGWSPRTTAVVEFFAVATNAPGSPTPTLDLGR